MTYTGCDDQRNLRTSLLTFKVAMSRVALYAWSGLVGLVLLGVLFAPSHANASVARREQAGLRTLAEVEDGKRVGSAMSGHWGNSAGHRGRTAGYTSAGGSATATMMAALAALLLVMAAILGWAMVRIRRGSAAEILKRWHAASELSTEDYRELLEVLG